MAKGNFKNYASNKLFIGIFHNSPDDNSDFYDWEYLSDVYEKLVQKIFKNNAKYISLDSGEYEGGSIGINYYELMTDFSFDWKGAKKRKALRIKLESGLQKLFKELNEKLSHIFDIIWLGIKWKFDNGETAYAEYKEWAEEI